VASSQRAAAPAPGLTGAEQTAPRTLAGCVSLHGRMSPQPSPVTSTTGKPAALNRGSFGFGWMRTRLGEEKCRGRERVDEAVGRIFFLACMCAIVDRLVP